MFSQALSWRKRFWTEAKKKQNHTMLHEDHEFVEHSTIAEVMEWVKDSQGGEKK